MRSNADRAGPERSRSLLLALELAGPVLIVAAVAVLMNDYFAGVISSSNTDLPTVFLPNHCLLGESLRAGTIPGWNPSVMGGAPFAGDPQSGWMYLPAMFLTVLLPCAKAVSVLLVCHLWLAGTGLYAFLRGEGCSRAASTVAGLILALSSAGSTLVNSLPFGGALAWSAIVLACASRLFSARTWPKRLLWLLPTALAWGQLAAIHLSQGLIIGTVALLALCIYRVARAIRAGDLTIVEALGLVTLLVVVLGAVNLAYLLPRFAFFPHSTFSLGFRRLAEISTGFRGTRPSFSIGKALEPSFPLRLGLSPGGYFGAIGLMLAFAGLMRPRHRALTLTFLLYGAAILLASSRWVIEGLESVLLRVPGGEFATHHPGRLAHAVPLAIAIVAGLGVDAWREEESTRTRILMLIPGSAIFAALPYLLGADDERMHLLWIGAVAGAIALLAIARWPRVAIILPFILTIELGVNVISGRTFEGTYRTGLETDNEWWPLEPVKDSVIDLVDYERGGDIARRVTSDRRGRIVTLVPGPRRFRSVLSGAEEAQGYNPAQLVRYWTFIRFVYREPLIYSHSTLSVAPEAVQDLLAVGWLAKSGGERFPGLLAPVAEEASVFLFPLRDPVPRVSVIADVAMVDGEGASLRAVAQPGFDSERTVVVENGTSGVDGASFATDGQPGNASYEAINTQGARVEVRAEERSILLVRNTYDRNWTATLDGEPVEVVPADYFLQGVPIPPGNHVVELTYRDPSIGWGVAGSLVSIGALLAAALAVALATRRSVG